MERYRVESQPDLSQDPDPTRTTEFSLTPGQFSGILAVINAVDPAKYDIRIEKFRPPRKLQGAWLNVGDYLPKSPNYISWVGKYQPGDEKKILETLEETPQRYIFAVENVAPGHPVEENFILLHSENLEPLQGITTAAGWYGISPGKIVRVYDQGQEMQIGA